MMRPIFLSLALAGLPIALPAYAAADESTTTAETQKIILRDAEQFRIGRQAMADSLYGVAAENFRTLASSTELSDEDRLTVEVLLLEALVRDGQAVDAVLVTSGFDPAAPPAGLFWGAQGFAAAGRLADAADWFSRYLESGDTRYVLAASLSQADVLLWLREPAAALEVIEAALERNGSIEESDRVWLFLKGAEVLLATSDFEKAEQWLTQLDGDALTPVSSLLRDYLAAQVDLGLGRFKEAAVRFGGLLNQPDGGKLPPKVAGAAALGQAHAALAAGTPEDAVLTLKKMVNDPAIESEEALNAAFKLLAEFGVFETSDRGVAHEGDVREWVRSGRPLIASLATFHQVKHMLKQSPVEAWDLLESYRKWLGPGAELSPSLKLLEAETLIELGQLEPARILLTTLEEGTLAMDEETKRWFLLGVASIRSGRYSDAQRAFANAALRAAPDVSSAANYNAAVASMQSGENHGFQQYLGNLEKSGHQGLAAQLLLERGIYLSERQPELARVAIWQYIRSFPRRAENARAYIVLAEIALRQSPPAPDKARNQLSHVSDSGTLREDVEKRDYLLIWVADLEGSAPEAIKRALLFLEAWPDSVYADATRMKLAEIYFNSGDYVNARGQFEFLAKSSKDSDLVERALFFAGRSAALSLSDKGLDDAITLFQKVIDYDGKLLLRARREQAAVLVRQGKIDDAVDLLNVVLAENAKPTEDEYFDVLQQKGEILLGNRADDKAALTEAEQVFQVMVDRGRDASGGDVARHLAEGRFGLGRIAELRGLPDRALAQYYSIFESSDGEEGAPSGSVAWRFRAGMNAVDLLIREKRWKAAARLAGRVSKLPHPRAAEARDIAERIELNHFIWKNE
ncbi:tetratricopeptide repeat protein [Sulfuriroseicoccus oceanibius]|uniref:Tetratricopeptide repeat protein n=1 Tax=Sulfuriroseicoccus oceanibius TaxID=2707525 RepID=A0A6B3L3L4_9BACT|nr:tetratricopeptide repeat protein [Sulfuriroseicoccus oceanibius]QQL44027.1 tetratricopeptide repeat protein [Sulfuriroseicoccus oceanibius]